MYLYCYHCQKMVEHIELKDADYLKGLTGGIPITQRYVYRCVHCNSQHLYYTTYKPMVCYTISSGSLDDR